MVANRACAPRALTVTVTAGTASVTCPSCTPRAAIIRCTVPTVVTIGGRIRICSFAVSTAVTSFGAGAVAKQTIDPLVALLHFLFALVFASIVAEGATGRLANYTREASHQPQHEFTGPLGTDI